MRLPVLFAPVVLLAASCATTPETQQGYAKANSLMQKEIRTRIQSIPFQHRQELINNLLWLQTKAGELAIPDLLTALKHDVPKVRSSACWVLGRIRDRRVIEQLRPLAKDSNEAVRMEAARALVTMGDMRHAEILIEGLDSDKVPVRYNCHMALKDATSRDFQYDHLEEDSNERRLAVLRWRTWWAEQSQDPWFAKRYAQEHGLEYSGPQLPGQKHAVPAAPMTETKKPTAPEHQPTPGTTAPKHDAPTPQAQHSGEVEPVSPKAPVQAPQGQVPAHQVPAPQTPAPQTPAPTSGQSGATKTPAAHDTQPVEPWVKKMLDTVQGDEGKAGTPAPGTGEQSKSTPPKAGQPQPKTEQPKAEQPKADQHGKTEQSGKHE
ncbi:MAG: HEAT repeat domain-containing protein [Planctomycetes bacterium]|nr:HEAT repeat domain-containing protein [Planctomycetota bacterium]